MNNVDERVVEMKFDNKQFENGVQTSLKSLDQLKRGLDLEESAKSLSNLAKVGKSFSLAGIGDGLRTLESKFTALGIVGVTALQRISNAAITTGKRIVSALTVDPIKMGFREYETQINAVQTILANTKSKGTTLDQVNKALDELNTYADKTIYNFTEMTRNIGTFTAAGTDLDTSVKAIKGIANLAAVSGSNSQQASTAMYQLSQALSSGTVKLMDWNSVVNAGMGGQVFQDALKETARVQGIAIDAMIKKEGSFRETLKSGWLTKDVLTATLEKFTYDTEEMTAAELEQTKASLKSKGYTDEQVKSILELGKTASDAATKVKTFTQLFDTLKEAAQSGWTQSWEIIVGDFEEAKALLTEFSDILGKMIGESADARNSVLEDWKKLGGRTDLIESVRNTFQAVLSVVKPVKEAFREVFPPITGERLAALTKGLKEFTAKLKMDDETAKNVKNTLKGFFSIVSIGVKAVSAIARAAKNLAVALLPAAKKLLEFTGGIGTWLTGADKAITKSDLFNKAFERLRDIVVKVAGGVKSGLGKMIDAFQRFTGIDLSGFDKFSESIRKKFGFFDKVGAFIGKAVSWIGDKLKKLGPILADFGKTLGKVFSGSGMTGVLNLLNGGLLATLIIGLKNISKSVVGVIDSIKGITDDAGGFLKRVTSILDGVRDCLKAYQRDIQSKTLLRIAEAIGILAVALVALSLVDPAKLSGAVVALTTLFADLFGFLYLFDKKLGGGKLKGTVKLTAFTAIMIGVATAILILSAAVATLSKTDWNGLIKGIAGVSALAAMLIIVAEKLSKYTGKIAKTSIGLILFGFAIKILVDSVAALGKMSVESLIKGLLGVLSLCAALSLFLMANQFNTMSLNEAAGILALAIALRIMASAIKAMGAIKPDEMSQGLIGIGWVLAELTAFIKLNGNSKDIIKTAFGLTVLGAAMLIMANAVKKFGTMDPDVIGLGMMALGVALGILVGALRLMPKNMAGIGIGMLAMAAGLVLMGKALAIMGNMSIDQIGKSLIALGFALMILVVSVNAMKGALAGAAALVVVTAALIGLAIVLRILGSMPIANIGKALLALVGVFVVLGGAAAILSSVTPAMLLLGAALLVMGIGLAAVGAAVIILSIGLNALGGKGGIAGVGVLLALAAALLPLTYLAPSMFLVGAALAVVALGVLALGAGLSVLSGGLALLVAIGPKGTEALLLLANTAAQVANFAAQLIAAGVGMLFFGAGAIVAGAGSLVAAVGIAMLAIALRLLSGVDIDNIKNVSDIADDLLAAAALLLLAAPGLTVGGAALVAFGLGAASTASGLSSINDGISGIVKSVKKMPGDIKEATTAITDSMNVLSGEVSRSIREAIPETSAAAGEVSDAASNAIRSKQSQYFQAGSYVVDGFINGIRSRITDAANSAAYMAQAALNAARARLDINSPSGEFEDVGELSDVGLAKGLKKYAFLVSRAATGVGDSMIQPVLSMNSSLISGRGAMEKALVGMTSGASRFSPSITAERNTTVRHTFDPITVKGINNKGELVATADYAVEDVVATLMRRQNRI